MWLRQTSNMLALAIFIFILPLSIFGTRINLTPDVKYISIPSAPKSFSKLVITGLPSCPRATPACICYSGPQPWSVLGTTHPCPPDYIYYCFFKDGAISSVNDHESFTATNEVELKFTMGGIILNSVSALLPPNTYKLENAAQKAIKINFVGCSTAHAYLDGDIGENPTRLDEPLQYERVSTLSHEMDDYIFQGADTFYITFKGVENLREACVCYSSFISTTVSNLPCPESEGETLSQICIFADDINGGYFASSQRGQRIALAANGPFVHVELYPTKTLVGHWSVNNEAPQMKFFDCYRTSSSKAEKCIRMGVVGNAEVKIFVSGLVKGRITTPSATIVQ